MAEYGSVAAGQHGGVAPPVIGESGVAHRVNPAVNPSQSVCLVGPRDMPLGESECAKLAERDHAMLRLGQIGQLFVRTHFSPHTGDKCVRVQTLPPGNICSPG